MESILEKLQALAADHPPSLPLKLLVVADCCGRTAAGPVRATSGAEGLMRELKPLLKFAADNKLEKSGAKIPLELEIRELADFHPDSLVSRIDWLAKAARENNPAMAEQLDAILHHAEFQRMEACWLGLDRLCREVGTGAGLQLEVLPATRKDLGDTFHQSIYEPEYASSPETPLSAVFFDFRFSHEPGDLPLLETLAADCASLQAPMIAGVHPGFFQLKNLAHLPNLPDIAGKLQLPAYAGWRRFQTDEKARWTCLTANRYLAREPYVLQAEAGAALDYQEKADASHPEMYLWAEAGWLVCCNLARSFSRYRHCVVLDGMGPETAHGDLPVRPFPKKANLMVPSPTEILIDDEKAWEIVRGGVTMLVGISDGAVATFPLLANAFRLRPGVLTTESALSYQLFAGHLSHFLMGLYDEIPTDSGSEAVQGFVRQKLQEFLIPFCGDNPEESVAVTVAEVSGEPSSRVLNLTLKPVLKIQSKDVDFNLQLKI